MSEWVLKLKRNSFIRNVVIVASGTAAAQVITLLFTPLITRLYGPEAFGILGTFNSIVFIAAPAAALTYPIAIVLPKDGEEARGLVRLSLGIAALVSLLAAVVILFMSDSLAGWLHLEDLHFVLYLIPVYILLTGLLQTAEQWLIRTQQFQAAAKASVAHSVILNGSKAGAGLIYPAGMVLIILTVFGQLFKALMMIAWSKGFIRRGKDEQPAAERLPLWVLIKKYRDFPLFRTPQIFLNSISQSLPTLSLTILFGPAAAGFYTLGKNVLSMPSQLIAKSVGDVFYPKITEAANQGEDISKLLIKATWSLTMIGLIPFGLIAAFGPVLFAIVFGGSWQIAGEYARWMALWVFAAFLNRPAVSAIPVLGLQDRFLLYEIISTMVRFGAIYIGFVLFKSDLASIILYSLASVVLNLSLIFYTIRQAQSVNSKLKVRECVHE